MNTHKAQLLQWDIAIMDLSYQKQIFKCSNNRCKTMAHLGSFKLFWHLKIGIDLEQGSLRLILQQNKNGRKKEFFPSLYLNFNFCAKFPLLSEPVTYVWTYICHLYFDPCVFLCYLKLLTSTSQLFGKYFQICTLATHHSILHES